MSFGRESQMNARTPEPSAPVPHTPRQPGAVHRSGTGSGRVPTRRPAARRRLAWVSGCLLLGTTSGCGEVETGSVRRGWVGDPDQSAPRMVSLVPSLAELVVALGAGDALVGRTDYDTHPDIVALPSVGGGLDPSLEALVELEVDVVLMPEGQEMPELAARLSDLGISATGFRTETVGNLFESIARIGTLTGREEAADSLAERIARRLEEVRSGVADRDPVSVMYVVWSDPPQTTAGGTYIDELIALAGGRNVFADAPTRWPTVGYESIVRRNPSVIVWPRGADSGVSLEVVQRMPGWRDLDAVQAGRVVFVDSDRFNRPGPELPDAAMELAQALHPGVGLDGRQ